MNQTNSIKDVPTPPMVKYPWSRARGLLGQAMEERTWRKGEF